MIIMFHWFLIKINLSINTLMQLIKIKIFKVVSLDLEIRFQLLMIMQIAEECSMDMHANLNAELLRI